MNKIREIITNIANNVIRIVFAIIVIGLTIASIFSTCVIIQKETTEYRADNWILNILAIIVLVAIIVFIKRKNIKLKERTIKILLVVIVIGWIVISFIWVFGTQLLPKADQKYIYKAAIQIFEKNFSSFREQKGYINSNPQQEGMVLLEYAISLINKENMYLIVQLLNIFALLMSFYVIYKITNIMFKDKKISIITFICLLAFIPMFFYITFMYGNIFGLLASMIGILFELKYFEKRKWKYLLISGISIALAIKLKSNYLIIFIAMILLIISDFFDDNKINNGDIKENYNEISVSIAKKQKRINYLLYDKKLINIIAIVVLLLIYLAINVLTKFSIEKLTGSHIENGIPMTTYIAMGMQESERAPGWYNGYNRKAYKKNKRDYEKTNEKAINDIKDRLNVFKQNPKYAFEFYGKKILSQWNNPTFQGFWVNKARKSNINARWYKGVVGNTIVNKVLTECLNIVQTLILFGATIYIILDYKKVKGNKLSLIVVFIGGFLFHIIWEAKCQYTITYFILLIPYCVKGYDLLTEKFKGRKYKEMNLIKILKEHMEYRQQIVKLAKADLIKTYRGAALGWSWAIIKPTVTIFVYWFAFEIGLRSGKDVNGYPFFLWLIAGLIPWFYISDMLTAGTDSIRKYSYLVTKMKFPVSTIPTFVSLSKLAVNLILTIVMIIIFWAFGFAPDLYYLQIIFFVILSFAFWTVWALFSSLLAAISKDFANLVKSFVSAVFWLSGILWAPENIKILWLKKVLRLNPVTYIVSGFRNCFINKIWFWEQPKRLLYFGIAFVIMILLALWAYRKVRKEIPDVL